MRRDFSLLKHPLSIDTRAKIPASWRSEKLSMHHLYWSIRPIEQYIDMDSGEPVQPDSGRLRHFPWLLQQQPTTKHRRNVWDKDKRWGNLLDWCAIHTNAHTKRTKRNILKKTNGKWKQSDSITFVFLLLCHLLFTCNNVVC